jgi:hypothetical protein
MLARLEMSVGRGHATLHLDVSRGDGPVTRRRFGLLAVALAMPIVLVIAAQSIGLLTGWYSLDRLMSAPGPPWVYVLTAATCSVLLALGIIVVARLRIVAERGEGSRRLAVTLCLTGLEALALGIAAGVLALFVVHLVADGVACARGVREAC